MQWKTLFLGGLITSLLFPFILFVVQNTIAKSQEPKENLVYQELPSTNVELNNRKISSRSMTITNTGKLPSKNVRIVIQFQNNVKV